MAMVHLPVNEGSFDLTSIMKVITPAIIKKRLVCVSVNQIPTMKGMVQATNFMFDLENRFASVIANVFKSILIRI
jgi:hypothetical protein